MELEEHPAQAPMPPVAAERALRLLARWAVRRARRGVEAAGKAGVEAVTGNGEGN